MLRRVAVAVLQPPSWVPPGIEPDAWRIALAEDVLDVLALMNEVDSAVAVREADEALLGEVGWPGLTAYRLVDLHLPTMFAAATADGYSQAALVVGDAPDMPGLHIAKLLRPLTSHPVAVAQTVGGSGLLGLASVLPAPAWLPDAGLDDLTPQALRRVAPQPSDVAAGSGWHRLRSPDDLARLDLRLEGWEATRALLTAR